MSFKPGQTKVSSEMLISVLGLVYVHYRIPGSGDLYLTPYGMRHAALLKIENWYDPEWFTTHRQRLSGTSAVYRVPTRPVHGQSLDLVVKNSRVGEEVPTDTHMFIEFINAQFNSPWEEFSLTMELQDGKFGDKNITIKTQEPLAIFVPSETMQPWQSGRSIDRIRRIEARHPGIDIDILRQYKLVYGWIHGMDLVECLDLLELPEAESTRHCIRFTRETIQALKEKGFEVADMKASHIIIAESDVTELTRIHTSGGNGTAYLQNLIATFQYSIIDYELLTRTPDHTTEVFKARRRIYLNCQLDRFKKTSVPPFLKTSKIMGVPYVCGHTESTGGRLWVVGKNSKLFDYFLPERWRRTYSWKLSESSEIFYTISKDSIQLVWKTSRVGEIPCPNPNHPCARAIIDFGYNSPFEEFAIAHDLANKGIGVVYVRAIYRTGSKKLMPSTDHSRYRSHDGLSCPDGTPLLQHGYNYISLRGYFNGTDDWVATHHGVLCRPVDLLKAVTLEYITPSTAERIKADTMDDLYHAGYDGDLLSMDDILLALTPDSTLLKDQHGAIDARICNFEFIKHRPR